MIWLKRMEKALKVKRKEMKQNMPADAGFDDFPRRRPSMQGRGCLSWLGQLELEAVASVR